MERWSGRVVLVTGASAGIGLALAEALANHGMKVVACARNVQKIQELSSSLQQSGCSGLVHAVRCDVSKEEDIVAMFEAIRTQFGGADVCINNAGVAHDVKLIDGDTDKLRSMLEVNVLGLTVCTKEAVTCMRERGVDDGHILHVNSMAAHSPCTTMYGATKTAVLALTEGVRNELRQINSNIRITSVSPGLVETEFLLRMKGQEGLDIYKTYPVLQSKDIVDAILYQLAAPPHVQIHDLLIRPTQQLK